jgi:hypothetical protein
MKNNQKGQALIIVLLITVFIFLIGSAALTMGITVRKTSVHEKNQNQAYYVAEAGVEKLLAEALKNPDWVKGLPEGTPQNFLQNMSYPDAITGNEIESVNVVKTTELDGYKLVITSVGRYSGGTRYNSKRTLNVVAKLYPSPSLDFSKGVWGGTSVLLLNNGIISSDIWSNGDIEIKNNGTVNDDTVVEGNVYAVGNVLLDNKVEVGKNIEAKGNVTVSNNAKANTVNLSGGWVKSEGSISVGGGTTKIHGDAWAAGSISISKTGYIKAPHPNTPLPIVSFTLPAFPVLEQEIYRKIADYEYTGNTTFTTSELTNIRGVHFVNGDISISGTYSGLATIIATGKISITGNLFRSSTSDCLALLSFSDVETSTGCNPIWALIYAANIFNLNNNSWVYGAAIANKVIQGQNTRIFYNQDLVDLGPPGMDCKIIIISWKEQ